MYPPDHWLSRPVAYFMAEFSRERRAERARVVRPEPVRYRPKPYITPEEKAELIAKMAGKRKEFTREERLWHAKPIRTRLYKAQNGLCYLCGKPMAGKSGRGMPTEDHVVPRARGGKNAANRLLAHSRCNGWKHCREPYACELLYLQIVNLQVVYRARAVTPEQASERRARLVRPSALTPETGHREALQAAE